MGDYTVTDVRVYPGDSGFLLDDGVTAVLYDSGFGFTGFEMADRINAALGSRPLDYIFLTHSHYDHALGSACVTQRFPGAKVVAAQHAAAVFRRPGALAVMAELDGKKAARRGVTKPIFYGDGLRVDIEVNDGDVIRVGVRSFEALSLPGHTKCSMGFYCPEERLLLSCETLGVYDGESTIAPAFLVGYQSSLEAIDRVSTLDIRHIVSPHFGLLSEEQTAWFIGHARRAAENAARSIAQLLESGAGEEQIFDWYSERYIRGRFEDIYPEDAARLNTSIMTRLIGKELLDR